MEEKEIGRVTNYYSKIAVAAIKLFAALRIGDTIRIKGRNVDFNQQVESMELDHRPIKMATNGKTIGLKVNNRVRRGYKVYRVRKA